MSLRVISGSAKGTRLKLVPGDGTRPIMDRVKESLFNILGRAVIDSNFLDLFAGTGSVAIEALSRGAAFATLIDIDSKAIRTIQENLILTRLGERAVVRRQDAFTFLRGQPDRRYDILYIAPPQYKSLWSDALQLIDALPQWVHPTGQIVVQIDPLERANVTLKNFVVTDTRAYGNTVLWFFNWTHSPDLMNDTSVKLEKIVSELMILYAITAPPIPLERMLQAPAAGMWGDIDPSNISLSFFKVDVPFSPRMSLARFLARTIATSPWGIARGLNTFDAIDSDEVFQRFARTIMMPASMIQELQPDARKPALMSAHFEVPEDDAALRLFDVRDYL
ncbi:MAG: 16S rRNA (guanine(966)-N(2))-methyltransferase RsmD [Chloroflexota bacterium]|nr:16S rRNA (guanine(966)-N(2))-methyltransferase RsmD [Chloroflexota bacterium]